MFEKKFAHDNMNKPHSNIFTTANRPKTIPKS